MALEDFASSANLSDANSSLMIQPHVALGIYDVNESMLVRGIAVLTTSSSGFNSNTVISVTQKQAVNGNISLIDSGLVLSEELVIKLQDLKGISYNCRCNMRNAESRFK